MYLHDFQEFANSLLTDPSRRTNAERHRWEAIAEIVEYTLGALRKLRHPTQEELSEILFIKQASVSRLEHTGVGATRLTTLRNFMEALGGTIEVAAVFGKDCFPLSLE